MYSKCGSMVNAQRVFDRMPSHSVVSWNTLILGYAESGDGASALKLFSSITCAPDALSFVGAFKACISLAGNETGEIVRGKLVKLKALERAMALHSEMLSAPGLNRDYVLLLNTLLDMYAKCGTMSDARRVFDRMKLHTLASWNALLLGYSESDEDVALELFARIQQQQQQGSFSMDSRTFLAAIKSCMKLSEKESKDGVDMKLRALEQGAALHSLATNSGLDSDLFVASSLVELYSKCGNLAEARRVFDRIPTPDAVSCTALMLGYAENDQGDSALDFFTKLRLENARADAQVFVSLLKACGSSSVVDLKIVKAIHGEISRQGLELQPLLSNAILDAYCKCGSVRDAEQVFDACFSRDSVVYTSLIAGHSRAGAPEMVFEKFRCMLEENLQPDAVTFTCLLTACSHAGLVERGKGLLRGMFSGYGVRPRREHFHCVVDMLGRAKELEEALEIVEGMPWGADAVTWTVVLAACEKWKNSEVAELAFEKLRCFGDRDAAASLSLVANVYSGR